LPIGQIPDLITLPLQEIAAIDIAIAVEIACQAGENYLSQGERIDYTTRVAKGMNGKIDRSRIGRKSRKNRNSILDRHLPNSGNCPDKQPASPLAIMNDFHFAMFIRDIH
jgi:hypothetical protein